jgi:tripartite-type tricarboxylate transporter receptor subunit TctC
MSLRTFSSAWLALVAALALSAPCAHAEQPYPAKPIRLVVAYAAGGGTDVAARIFAESLSRVLQRPVFVENKAGASGNIGGDFVAKASPDGYTLLFGAMANLAINPHLFKDMPYAPERDFIAIAQVFDTNHVIVAGPKSKISSFNQLVTDARANPGKLTYASAGAGTSTHVVAELFAQATGTRLTHIPYRGNGPALVDVMSGQVDLMFDQVPNSAPYVAASKVTALAVTSAKRLPSMPEVPSVAEVGYPQLVTSSWTGLFAPAGLPAPIVAKLNEATGKVLADPDTRAKLEKAGAIPTYTSAEAMAKLLRNDSKRFGALVQKAGIKAD